MDENSKMGWREGMEKSKIMAKVKYDFPTNKGRNKCNTSFSSNFDWKKHFLYYFLKLRNCVIPHFHGIVTGKSFLWYYVCDSR